MALQAVPTRKTSGTVQDPALAKSELVRDLQSLRTDTSYMDLCSVIDGLNPGSNLPKSMIMLSNPQGEIGIIMHNSETQETTFLVGKGKQIDRVDPEGFVDYLVRVAGENTPLDDRLSHLRTQIRAGLEEKVAEVTETLSSRANSSPPQEAAALKTAAKTFGHVNVNNRLRFIVDA